MTDVLLRQDTRPGDRDAVENTTRSTGFFTEHEVGIALEVYDEFIAVPASGYRFVFADIGQEAVGFASWGWDEQTESSYELYWIVVDSRFREAGIGKQLLAFAEADIRRHGPAQLFVETSGKDLYLPTRKFYERRGYTQAAWLTDYFGVGDARVIYSKRL